MLPSWEEGPQGQGSAARPRAGPPPAQGPRAHPCLASWGCCRNRHKLGGLKQQRLGSSWGWWTRGRGFWEQGLQVGGWAVVQPPHAPLHTHTWTTACFSPMPGSWLGGMGACPLEMNDKSPGIIPGGASCSWVPLPPAVSPVSRPPLESPSLLRHLVMSAMPRGEWHTF